MKYIRLLLLPMVCAFLIRCNQSESRIVSSRSDGPYIFYKNSKIQVITKDDDTIRRIFLDSTKLDNVTFCCGIDSPFIDSFKFHLNPHVTVDNDSFIMPERIFAMSDIEGNYERFKKILIANHIIDKDYNWTFGSGHLVIIGDLVDRGKHVTQCLWLIYLLEQKSNEQGGQVHYVLGNHEQLMLSGFTNYADDKYKLMIQKLKIKPIEMYAQSSELGRWLRTKNGILKIGHLLFVHGGINPSMLKYNLSIRSINEIIRKDIDKSEYKTDKEMDLMTGDGILWYRGFIESSDTYPKISQLEIKNIQNLYHCDRFVIGHTPVDSVSADYNGTIIRLDVDHYDNCQALLIENKVFYRVDIKGNKQKI